MNEQVTEQPTEGKGRKRSLMPFWILLAVSGLPYLFSWIYFANVDRLPQVDSSNRGELIQPVRSIENLALELIDGNQLLTNDLKGNWTLLTSGSSQCDEVCMNNVYYLRQIRRLMGEERTRIKRMFVLLDDSQLDGFRHKIEPFGEMDVIKSVGNDLITKMTVNGTSPENRIFIIDPMANLIMVYNPGTDPEDIAKDFRRLLKVVRIGKPKVAG
jgi:cytochrome oxidase Cu insertion factor (SCO1/SenC/PrrC family)